MKEMKNALKFVHTSVKEWYAGVDSSPIEKEQKFVPFSFIYKPSYLYLTPE